MYLFPPRPIQTTHYTELKKYDNKSFIAQPKYNGTCCNVFISEDEIHVMNRHKGTITSNYTDIDIIYFDKQSLFDSSLDSLSQTLKHLEFHTESDFSQPVNNLPQGLIILIMGNSFIEHVDNLQDSLKSLILTGLLLIT
jgi:hypothetical protein